MKENSIKIYEEITKHELDEVAGPVTTAFNTELRLFVCKKCDFEFFYEKCEREKHISFINITRSIKNSKIDVNNLEGETIHRKGSMTFYHGNVKVEETKTCDQYIIEDILE